VESDSAALAGGRTGVPRLAAGTAIGAFALAAAEAGSEPSTLAMSVTTTRGRSSSEPRLSDYLNAAPTVYGYGARKPPAPLAQSAERLHGKEKVYGSIP
jgi:hypothetical protein